ncbi:aspartyl-tRNA(Asn)/glutamyl-tRNA(Gln) amidotransferase subunit A [Thermosporothrix hazakensis]|jgi:aspartyl-tRNA(Asn)/glutamyl-tRNA(Gln) amidotransferase subunit A|uniref:Aspartyl-tRNA(Asn)/glutamyl-tRNA(Gln) amidotransferase subunit A n=1 Tax=Thermosporothrix hazakensis TaxID=644383 RepID=A0A326U0X0_THEHA|nr:amidase [Thermosporothrix hazakensis]PZW22997.1 aspartyl-tRNA(Asn)/glutamyl-tRNA(Gln) amidotransferase subunit A [Thermosporothrix hazakensis]GCE48309.1 amidase [Thermosporothrix hazakensis]
MPYTSIRETAEEIRAGIITPTELVEEIFARIEQVEGEIQAFVTLMKEEALRDAEQAEKELRTGLYRSPLQGIPIAVKDLIHVKGVPTTAGSAILENHVATEDAAVVEQLRKAGAIIIGKTRNFEFAYGPFSAPTCNPWNHLRSAGGSSGGSAAAVAAGMCLGAIGTDTGGSIRVPSSCCGITGLKPTYGRVSCYGVIPLSWSLDHVGPMGHSAEDCALLFDVIAKYDPRDPNSVSGPPSAPSRSTANLIKGVEGRGPLSLQGLRVGVVQESFVAPLDPEIRAAWKATLRVLEENGVEVIEIEVPVPTITLYRTIQKPEATLAHKQQGWFEQQLEKYGETVRTRLLEGAQISAVDYVQALHEKWSLSGSMRSALRQIHAFVLPTIPVPPIPLEHEGKTVVVDGEVNNAADTLLRLTMPFNITGLPAVSFPAGFTQDGLPIGMQVVGKPFEEATILRMVHAYQQLTDWHRRELPA